MQESAKTALIADDSLTERTHLSRILQDMGLQVISAGSGNEAITLAEQHQPDMVFLDIIMDDGDGYKACRSIKRNSAIAATPVIMVSSKSNRVDRKWAERLGAVGYVTKPYSEQAIIDVIQSL